MRRLLLVSKETPYENIALEEALLKKTEYFTIRIWENQESIIIGRGQLAHYETYVQKCIEERIPIVRRISGGGAVYNGKGNLNWSFFIPRGFISDKIGFTRDPRKLILSTGSLISEILQDLGVNCCFDGTSSVLMGGKKISGISAYIAIDAVLCHGTLLYAADLERIKRLLKPHGPENERKYVQSLRKEMGNCAVNPADFVSELINFFGFDSVNKEETEEEKSLTEALLEEKYLKETWNIGDPFVF